jgi:hypothetical protein
MNLHTVCNQTVVSANKQDTSPLKLCLFFSTFVSLCFARTKNSSVKDGLFGVNVF